MKTLMKLLMVTALLFSNGTVMACDVCEKQQPKILRGITHGAGPESNWDYVAVWTTVAIVMVSLVYAVKWIVHPGEKESEHVKRSIFNSEEL